MTIFVSTTTTEFAFFLPLAHAREVKDYTLVRCVSSIIAAMENHRTGECSGLIMLKKVNIARAIISYRWV